MQKYFCLCVLILIYCCRPNVHKPEDRENKATIDTAVHKKIILSSPADSNSLIFLQGHLLYTEIFKRLGYEFEGISAPTERSMILANSGQTDGDGGRIIEFDSLSYPNLVKTREPVFIVNMAAYSKNTSIKIEGWQSFKDYNNLIIGYIHGSVETSVKIDDLVNPKNLVEITNTRQGCDMLAAGRIDVFIDIFEFMEYYLKTNKSLKHSGIACCGKIKQYKVYPYLNKKYTPLVPKVDSVVRLLKKTGEYQKIIKGGFTEYVAEKDQ